MYYPTVSSLAHIWFFSEYATYKHGLFLLGIGIYFFCQSWMKLRSEIAIRFDIVGFSLLTMASVIWFFAQIAEVQVVQQLIFIFIIYSILWTILGYRISRQLAFPILLLICAIPIWELMNEGFLQTITVKILAFMLRLIGVNTHIENVRIFLPEGTFSVEPKCAGMQQLVAAISLAAIYAYLNNFRLKFFLGYVVLVAIFSLTLNILRIFIVVVSGHLTNMQHYFIQVEHVSLGWALFGVGMFIFMMTSNKFLLSRYGSFITKPDDKKVFIKPDIAVSNRKFVFQLFLVLLGLSVGPLWAQIQSPKIQGGMGELIVPETFNQWRLSSNENYNYRPFYIPGDIVYEGSYTNGREDAVYCYIGYYRNQKQGKELISELNHIYDNKTWMKLDSKKRHIEISHLGFTVNETIVKTPQGREKLIWHWYYMADEQTSSEKVAKLLEVWSVLTGQSGASLFLVATDVNGSYAGSRNKLHRFLSDSLVDLEMAIEQISKSAK